MKRQFRSLRSRGSLPSLAGLAKNYASQALDPDIRKVVKEALGTKYRQTQMRTIEDYLAKADREMVGKR